MTSNLEAILSRMTDINETVPRFMGMLYGPSGSGKSTLAAMIARYITPPDKLILYLDTSEGWVAVRNIPGLATGIKQLPFTTIEDAKTLIEGIASNERGLGVIGTVILDEASTMAAIDLDRIYSTRTQGTVVNPIDDTPSWPDYRAAQSRFRILLSQVARAQGLNCILCAHTRSNKTPPATSASFPPGLAEEVKKPLHLVGYLTCDFGPVGLDGVPSYSRRVQVHPTTNFDAKTRMPIVEVKVDANELPMRIATWLQQGGKPVDHDSTPRPDENTGPPPSEEIAEVEPEIEPEIVPAVFD